MKLKQNLKKVLGVSMAVALVATTSALTAFAANDPEPFNLMPASADEVSGGTASMDNGVLTLQAGDAETEFMYDVSGSYNINDLMNLYFTLEHTGGFDIKIKTIAKNGETIPSVSADFGDDADFGSKTTDKNDPNVLGSLITTGPTFTDKQVGWKGAYGWNDNVPDNGMIEVQGVIVRVGANGTVKLSALYMGAVAGAPGTDAPQPTETEPSDTQPTETQPTEAPEVKTSIVSMNAADWAEQPDEKNNPAGSMVVENDADGALVFYNTNSNWPCAVNTLAEPIVIDKSGFLSYDITVAGTTNIILFFNEATPDDFQDKGYNVSLTKFIDPASESDDLVGGGKTFTGTIALADLGLPEGEATLTGVKVFAVGEANKPVVIRELALVTKGEPVTTPSTEPTDTTDTTDTTETTTTAAPATTTTAAQKDNPKTGDSTTLVMVGALLLVASAGTLVLTGKKAKSR
jgi:hypothetical protein